MGAPPDILIFSGGSQDKGIDTFNPDIAAEITWDEATVNVTTGVRKGVGPRYGMAPLAGHADSETTAGTVCNGLMASEAVATGQGLLSRELIFGIVPLTLTPYDGAYPKTRRRYYAYLVGLDDSSNVSLDVCVGCTLDSTVFEQSADIRAGLAASSYKGESPLIRRHKTELLNLPTISAATAADVATCLRAVGSRYWTPYSQITVSGKRVPYFNMFAGKVANGDITTAPNLQLWSRTLTSPTVIVYGGAPSEIITRSNVANNTRLISVYPFDTTGQPQDMKYTKEITDANTAAATAYATSTAMYTTLTGATKTGASVAYSSTAGALINDPGSYTNTRHDAILVAGESPYAVIYQDWLVATTGMKPRWVDLTQPACSPRLLTAIQDAGNNYNSCLPTASSVGSTRGANASGLFILDQYYEIGLSYYNKQIDYECNVVFAFPFINQDVTKPDGVYFTFDSDATQRNLYEFMRADAQGDHVPAWEYSDAVPNTANEVPRHFNINDYELRWYYREQGSTEWLPIEKYDAAEWWFYPYETTGPKLGAAPQGRPTGGYPGGFIDYSPLPKQRYICTLTYKNRAFWFSEKSLHFSNLNSIYAYATRNIFNVPSGTVRGGIVHIQPGETEQTSRLVIFASDQSYVGRFTGRKSLQQVRVSVDTVGQFEVDGSDFDIDFLCDATAYSYRAACVAEGILYFWGPQGVYMDDGIRQPVPITEHLDPEIASFVDLARVDEVHAVYNKTTKEIIWFYPPKTADATYPTYGLVYSTRSRQFYPLKFKYQIDSAQNLKIESDDTPDGIDGDRVLLHARATSASTVSRTYFFDELCKSGDQGPGTELLCKTVSTPVAGTRRLTFTVGHVATAGIVVNDYVAVQNVVGYAPTLTTANDFIAKVTAVAADYIEIALPTDAVLPDATLTLPAAFPVYHMAAAGAGLHGITWNKLTNYWLVDGLYQSWIWRYLYMLFKVSLWPAPLNVAGQKIGAVMSLVYRTLISSGTQTDTFELTNNSAGHAQVHHPLGNDEVAACGQALKYGLSGVHIGQEWTLEYLEAHCSKEKGFTLKEFEG